jgi:hypothetical protein
VRIVPFLLIVLAACGARIGDDDPDLRPDAHQLRNPDAAAEPPDAPPDAVALAMDNACGVAASFGDLGTLTGDAGAQLQDGSTTQRVRFVAAPTPTTAMQATPDLVQLELWDNYGVFDGGTAHTGTFTLSGAETDYDTCGVCVLLLANVANDTPAKMLLATSGTVTITSVGTTAGQMTQATINNATFGEISFVANEGYEPVTSNCPSPLSHADLRGTL